MLNQPLSPADTREVMARFDRDGYAVVRNVLSADECAQLRALSDCAAQQSPSFVIRRPEEFDLGFLQLFVREPFLSLAKEIVGPECRFCAQNVIRNQPSQAISHWHVDDLLEYPLPPDVPRWDARVRLPLIWFSIQVPLSDVLTLQDGPTEVVAGSQFSGRIPPKEDPVFDGRCAEPIFCHAGDIYLFNHQVWHRGRPNTGTRTRYLMQLQYARGDKLAARCQSAPITPGLKRVLEHADPELVAFMHRETHFV